MGGKITLVEPNTQGIKDIQELFEKRNIERGRYELHACTMETFKSDKKYDIVIAEGFLHATSNAPEIIGYIADFVKCGGVAVVTCMDYCSTFVEQMKRLICHMLICGVKDYKEQVEICTKFFEPQFGCLKGMSRSVEDWVKDDMLNPAFNAERLFGIVDMMECFPKEFKYLGSSQRMFTDYSWYKDVDYDERENISRQYKQKRHNLLMTGLEESILNEADSEYLYRKLGRIRELEKRFEKTYQWELINEIKTELMGLEEILNEIDKRCMDFANEVIEILENIGKKEIDYEKYAVFYNAVGRTQQYLSMVKQYG